jgi:hypothetical protein
MRTTVAAAALAAAVAAFLTPASAADLAFTLEHNLGPGGAWTRAGSLAGDLGGALAAAKAGRGVVPGLTLTRASTSLTAAEQAVFDGLVRAGGLYTIRATVEEDGGDASTTTTSVARPPAPLLASAPAGCVAARGGDAPLKLDGALTLSVPGDWGSPAGLEVSGLTFDFHSMRCGGGGGGGGEGAPARWAPPPTAAVPLWLPAAAPPVLPAPEAVAGRPGAPVSAPLVPEAGAEEEGGDGKEQPPEPPKRSNWIFILPLAMLVVNLMNAVAPPPAPSGGGAGRAPRRAE